MSSEELKNRRCTPCEGGVPPLTAEEADTMLAKLDGWTRNNDEINKTFTFGNYYETMAFVNAAAYVAHREDHHPDLLVKYKTCEVTYSTHAIGGLSENDFICAARLDALAG
jgi:4a-hydroxytetrahydrobiopterin dehydratase